MSDKLKNIIKGGVKVLLEVDIADLPQKQVVKDKSAHDTAVAQATADNITQKFRELGIDVPTDELATIELLKAKGVFGLQFKLNKSTKFFDGKTEVSGKAKVDGKSGKGKLKLYFTSDKGEKVAIIFDPEGLKTVRPETGQPMTILKENETYNVKMYGSKDRSSSDESIKQGEVSIVLNDGKTIVVKSHQVGKLSKMTSKSGKDYLVSANPQKQSDVKKGFTNVTIVRGSLTGKSFALPKSRLSTDKSTDVYFPENDKPQIVKKEDSNLMIQTKIMIISLPDFGGKGEKGDSNLRFSLNKPLRVDAKLDVNDKSKLSALNLGKLSLFQKDLKGIKASWSQSREGTLKLEIPGGGVIMLKPEHMDSQSAQFLGNWNDLEVEIGKFADGSETWEDVMGSATLRLSK
jgi:hypothetical protein